MPFNALVQEKILDFEALGIPEVFDRYVRFAPIQKPEQNNLAQVIVGTRRCGLQSLYLVFSLGDLSRSLADNPRSSSKVYAVDPGMFTAFSRAARSRDRDWRPQCSTSFAALLLRRVRARWRD